MIYIPDVSDPQGERKMLNISVREQTGHTFYKQTPTQRQLDGWQMRQSEDYEVARFNAPNYNELRTLADTYHDQSTIRKSVIVIKNHIKTTTTYVLGDDEPIITVEETDEEDGRTESRDGTMVQSTITSASGGMWELTLRVSGVYWDKDKEDDQDKEDDEEDDEAYDEDGDEIPGNSREYPLMQVSCSMEQQSILNHERIRQLGSTELAAISALLGGASQHDQIKVRSNKYRAIEDILDFSLGDGFGNCLSFVLANPTYSVPVTHITYTYKASNKPELPEQGKVVHGNALPGKLSIVEGYVCVFVGCGYSYRKGAPVFVEAGEEVQKKYEIEENYIVFYGNENLYK